MLKAAGVDKWTEYSGITINGEVVSHDFIKIVFGKFPDLLLFRFSKQPIASFSPDVGIGLTRRSKYDAIDMLVRK